MNVLSLDLEMNQPSNSIIQIGAVVGDTDTGEIKNELSIFIKISETLNPRIIELTGISQEQVDNGSTLIDAYHSLRDLAQAYECFLNPITWGGGDSLLLREQLKLEGDQGWCFGRRYIDVKTVFQTFQMAKNISPRSGLARSLTKYGLKFEGKKHNAVDDARNTFRMYYKLLSEIRKHSGS